MRGVDVAQARPDPTPFFAALADPTRLRLVEILARQPEERPLCVNALAARLGVSQPAVSQHLRVLRHLGLVRAERRGPRVHYFLDGVRFREWRRLVEETLDLAGDGD
jgi:ArsR family transcriptional regulator